MAVVGLVGDVVVAANGACVDSELLTALLLALAGCCDCGSLGLIGDLSAALAHICAVVVSHDFCCVEFAAAVSASSVVICLRTLRDALVVLTHRSHCSFPPDSTHIGRRH